MAKNRLRKKKINKYIAYATLCASLLSSGCSNINKDLAEAAVEGINQGIVNVFTPDYKEKPDTIEKKVK